MPIARKFLDWKQPALPAAADYLVQQYVRGQVFDLEHVVAVLPGRRAGRQLLELLVQRADSLSLVLVPPRIETVGKLPELLYEPRKPFASDVVQQLAWVHALRTLRRRQIARILPVLPADDDVLRWLELGKLVWREHRELAADGLDFGHVVSGWKNGGADEKARWQVLHNVQRAYLHILDQFALWDMQTARLFAIEHAECHTASEIVLIGTADMNRATRQMLDQVADHVTALIHAPESLADHFDEHGCLNIEIWKDRQIDFPLQQLRVVDGPADQADAVARVIAGYRGRYRADELTIGVPDDRLVFQIQRQLESCGVRTRWAVGRTVRETAPHRLLSAISAYVERRRFDDFAALVRHPDIDGWLVRKGIADGWLDELDRYYNEHLPPRLGQWLGPPGECARIRQVEQEVNALVAGLCEPARKLGEWSVPLVRLLQTVYGGLELDRDKAAEHYTIEACQRIRECLIQLAAAPPQLTPTLTATQAIALLLDQLHAAEIAPPADEEAVEMLGWLELPLDLAPALIVTSFNEGFVPKSLNSDLFLPNSLRRRLGLMDNTRRYARDAYALSVLQASRRALTLIVGRRDAEGDPLIPSRLLFAADRRAMAQRALRLFAAGDSARELPPLANVFRGTPASRPLEVPRPAPLERPIEAMSVTSFRAYLACPYRFYLRHVLGLQPVDDRAEELDGRLFGNLIHSVLSQFGGSPCRHSTSAAEIREFLEHATRQHVEQQLGSELLAAVNVQLMQLRTRLAAFAEWQAAWASDGWRIEFTEAPEHGAAPLEFGEQCMQVFGRIDRIDRHSGSGDWVILDYKTSDSAATPDQVHRRGGKWVDLQLPLYRHLAGSLGMRGSVRLGYVVLPKDTAKVGPLLATWTENELAESLQVARDVARRVRNEEFWPPAQPSPRILTDFGAICQDGVFDRVTEFGVPEVAS